jgi:hypothetical protein
MRVPRPSRRRRASTTTAYTRGGVERTRVAPAASLPTLAKKRKELKVVVQFAADRGGTLREIPPSA